MGTLQSGCVIAHFLPHCYYLTLWLEFLSCVLSGGGRVCRCGRVGVWVGVL